VQAGNCKAKRPHPIVSIRQFLAVSNAKSDLIILKAQGMKEDMQQLFNFQNRQVIINNPYNIKLIKNLSKEKVNFQFDINKKYIISVGRLIKSKRNHEIIEVLCSLSKDIELIFLGDGEQKDFLQNLAKSFNIENRVHFLGQVKNPYKYIARSDIFVSCSESEGFPNVLVESMICGTVVVSSDCVSGPREILGDNDYGLLFNIGDTDGLLKHINFLLNNIEAKKKYIRKAKKRAEDFSVENILQKYKEVLNIG
jgi:glycosyltransferase involved in cell wall biosynthesis